MSASDGGWKAIVSRYFGLPFYFATPFIYSLFLLGVFFSLMVHGYVTSKGSWLWAVLPAGGIIALAAYFLSYVTWLVHREGGFRAIGPVGIGIWLTLTVVSGVSLTASLTMITQASSVMAQTIENSIDAFMRTQEASRDMVFGGEYAKFLSTVKGGKTSLHNEIFNIRSNGRRREENTCGIGNGARAVIDNLARVLPGFTVISFTDTAHNCGRTGELEAIEARYLADIDARVADVEKTQFRLSERKAYYDSLNATVMEHLMHLDGVGKQLSDLTSRFDLPTLLQAQYALVRAEESYGKIQAGLLRLSLQRPEALPARIDVSPARQVLTWDGILAFLIKGAGPNGHTAVAAGALAWDLLMLRILYTFTQRWLSRHKQFAANASIDDVDRRGVSYLLRPSL